MKVTVASVFGVGAPEALLVGVVALVVFGPKGLAEVRLSGPHPAEHAMDDCRVQQAAMRQHLMRTLPMRRQQRALARV